jgi:uncharacterized protein Yka (UPF0111/DUF47 family)
VPTNYNDNSRGEVARLYVQISKLVVDLNYILSHLTEQNLNSDLKDKINKASDESEEALKLAKEALGEIEVLKG